MYRCSIMAVGLLLFSSATAHAQGARWAAEPIVRAGAADGPGSLADVFDVEIAPDDRILVGQPTIASMAVFDADGRYLRSVGRRGPGPGEFNVLGRLGWLGDTLWVVDFGRIHLFSQELEFIETIAPHLDRRPGVPHMIPGPLMGDGSIAFAGIPVPDDIPLPMILGTRRGDVLRTLGHEKDLRRSFRVTFADTQSTSVPDPWPSHSLWIHAADGESIVVVNRRTTEGRTFQVLRIDLNGDTAMKRAIQYSPRAISRDVADRAYRALADRFDGRRMTPAAVERALRDQVQFPRFAPPVSALVAGLDGTIWLRREDLRAESVEWQVLSESGQTIGTLSLPGDLDVKRARSNRVWGVVKDELDIPYVVTYAVTGSGGQ
jgi:hypothetical protein